MKNLLYLASFCLLLSSCGAPPEILPTATPTKPLVTPTEKVSESLPPNTVAGQVVDENQQPVSGAVVRIQATETHTISDANGEFQLAEINFDEPVSISAWAEGYFINNAVATSEEPLITIEIHRFPEEDNPDYGWLTSGNLSGEGENAGCAECHAVKDTHAQYPLPVDEWFMDAHSQAAVNPRFLTTYNGTDVHGNQSQLTKFILSDASRHNSASYNYVALPPDMSKPYYGPGYKIDFPESAGNCANCHVPGAAAKPNMNFAVDVNEIQGVEKEGVFCDFCHKIWDVQLLEDTGLPDPDSPGVMSYTFRRPPEGHQFFAGPFDDVAPGEDTYSPIQEESAYCAPCHFGEFWDTPIYNSFGEWLDSPYSDPETGQTCQDCHMPHTGTTLIALPDAGARQRDPETIFSHRMPGAMDEILLSNAVTMNVQTSSDENNLKIQVHITNDQTGHHVPTDYPGRQMILLVRAFDENGSELNQISGPTLPDWTGLGESKAGYYAGLPGEAYAKILQEGWTGLYPTVAYWNPNTILEDTRIAAFETASSEYQFEKPPDGQMRVEVTLLFRRSFIQVMDWKDWDTPDIIMEEAVLDVE